MAARKTKSNFNHWFIPFGGLALALILTALHTYFIVYASVIQSYRSTLVNQKASQLATFFDQRQNQLQRQLRTVANGETLVSMFMNADFDGLNRMEQLLVQTIPYGISVRLIPLGSARVDRDAELPFSFTSKDMVNRAELNQRVYAEAIATGEDWMITMAQAVHTPDGERVVGTLFAYIDKKAFVNDLELALGNDGEVILLQQFGVLDHKPILVLGEINKTEYPPVTRGLQSPHWEVQFTPASSIMSTDFGSAVDYILPLVLFFLIALLGLVVGAILANRALVQDASLLKERIGDAFRGRRAPEKKFIFTLFQDVDSTLDVLMPRATRDNSQTTAISTKQAEHIRAAVAKRPQPKAEAEITEFEESELEDEQEASIDTDGLTFNEEIYDEGIATIFRAYDIRGIVDETLTPSSIHRIGLAIGSEAAARGEDTIIIGIDGRRSGPDVADALIGGLRDTGRNVIDIGMVPTPLLYFATQYLPTKSGVMVTASHNPPEYNGFKVVLGGETLAQDGIAAIYDRFRDGDFSAGDGALTQEEIVEQYIATVCDDIVIAQPLKVVIDCGNGVAGVIAPRLFGELGCEVVELYCDVDGNFPNHAPDPSVPENLTDLIARVASENADVGIAFDGDGDRFVAVTRKGEIVWPDRLLMLFAKDVVSRNPGTDVIYDVKCTRHLNSVISSFGGRPIISKSGHSFLKARLADSEALLAGEMSGHFYFRDRWNGFDDGLYAAARLLELISEQGEDLKTLLAEFPHSVATPEIRVPVSEQEKFEVMDELAAKAKFGDATITSIDGLRVDYADGWGLVRVSNTTPNLVLRFEGDNVKALERIKGIFKKQISEIRRDLSTDF